MGVQTKMNANISFAPQHSSTSLIRAELPNAHKQTFQIPRIYTSVALYQARKLSHLSILCPLFCQLLLALNRLSYWGTSNGDFIKGHAGKSELKSPRESLAGTSAQWDLVDLTLHLTCGHEAEKCLPLGTAARATDTWQLALESLKAIYFVSKINQRVCSWGAQYYTDAGDRLASYFVFPCLTSYSSRGSMSIKGDAGSWTTSPRAVLTALKSARPITLYDIA